MKTTILVIILTCGCFASAYSQINQRHSSNKAVTDITDPSNAQFDVKPALDSQKSITFNRLWREKTFEGFSSDASLHTTKAQSAASMLDKMPCYSPDGLFSMRIIKPDSTIRYTILIEKY